MDLKFRQVSVEKILSDWKKLKFKPVYWLEGEEESFIDQLINYAEHQILECRACAPVRIQRGYCGKIFFTCDHRSQNSEIAPPKPAGKQFEPSRRLRPHTVMSREHA